MLHFQKAQPLTFLLVSFVPAIYKKKTPKNPKPQNPQPTPKQKPPWFPPSSPPPILK